MPFSALFGLESAIAALRRALERDQLAGTYLLAGPPGVGKTALARAFAEAAACLQPRTEPYDACGACGSCRRAAAGAHPEIAVIPPAGDQTQIWQFWDRDGRPAGALQHSLPFAPVVGRRRVYVVERADTLTTAAANSLLKALEEPPPYAVFVLLTPHPARMLPTVLSRAQTVHLHAGATADLAGWLEEVQGVEAGRAQRYAAYAEGRAGLALRLVRSPAAEDETARALELAESVPVASPLSALKVGERIRKVASGLKALVGDDTPQPANDAGEAVDASAKEPAGRRQLGVLLDLLIAYYRDLLAVGLQGPDARIVHADRRAQLMELSERGGTARWMADLEALLRARRHVDQNVSIALLTDYLAVQLVHE